nr:NAD-dependent epimerase/dehydratase family protein [Shimwellia pseudoproteus]
MITGATGLIGSDLLRQLVIAPSVTTIYAPTRRPLEAQPGVINPCDPQLLDALNTLDQPVDTVFCCLGTTRREAGSKAAFVQADYTLVLETGQAGLRLGARQMIVVSAMGANPHSLFFYNKVKGRMEQGLMAQGWPQLTVCRPSMLLGDRGKPRLNESIMAPLFGILPDRWRSIPARDVARAMVLSAMTPPTAPVAILNNSQLRALALGQG